MRRLCAPGTAAPALPREQGRESIGVAPDYGQSRTHSTGIFDAVS